MAERRRFTPEFKRQAVLANPRFEDRLKDLASRNGWFVPASQILDYLRSQLGWDGDLSYRDKVRLELLFFSNLVLRSILPAPSPATKVQTYVGGGAPFYTLAFSWRPVINSAVNEVPD